MLLDNWLILFNYCSDCINFYPTAEFSVPTGAQTNEANAKIETQLVTVQAKPTKCST